MADPVKGVEVRAEVHAVRSLEDGTYNITFNFPEDCLEQVKVLMGWLKDEVRMVLVREGQEHER